MAMKSSLTILFENPFWIGLFERIDGDKYEVCKITFGAEPKDYEVYDFLLKNWHKLKFSPPVKTEKSKNEKSIPNVCSGKSTASWKTRALERKPNKP